MNKNNKNHARTKLMLKIFGILLTAAGVAFAAVGFASFFGSMGGGGMPDKFWCCFVGFPLLFVGISMLSFGFRREITTYVKNESVPVINEASEEAKPALRAIGSALREGMSEAEANNSVCSVCRQKNDAAAKYCDNCGASLKKICPSCGNRTNPGAKFCDNCGTKL